MARTIRIELGPRSYDVRIGPGALYMLGAAAAALPRCRSVIVIADQTVADLYAAMALASLEAARLTATLVTFPPGECSKTLQTISTILDRLLTQRPAIDRDTVIAALGGGVTGDLAGFAAAIALRGLRWLQCPTTLLADVDSSVGGKTGVDHATGKNLIGAFHQPAGVIADVATLASLPVDELRNGLAECVKHGVIRDESLLAFIEENADALLACRGEEMTELVARNVAIKGAVVSADETERGQRAHLNYGHTVGHAIETLLGYQTIAHGQGVSLGMAAAGAMAVARRLLSERDHQRILALLARLGLPTKWPNLDAQQLWQIMQHDKKARSGKVRMILARGLGSVDIVSDIHEQEVMEGMAALEP
ncbi:MAG: 3-dehydroquinate synthase [Planctomycetaceae bacterium]|nr:3-dehydroquinate synthase [Planctomycetaceae bacterium]